MDIKKGVFRLIGGFVFVAGMFFTAGELGKIANIGIISMLMGTLIGIIYNEGDFLGFKKRIKIVNNRIDISVLKSKK